MIGGVRPEGRHQIGDVAQDEQLPRPAIENRFRRGARIAAGNHHCRGFLALFGQLSVALALGRIPPRHEVAVALDQEGRELLRHARILLYSVRPCRLAPDAAKINRYGVGAACKCAGAQRSKEF